MMKPTSIFGKVLTGNLNTPVIVPNRNASPGNPNLPTVNRAATGIVGHVVRGLFQ